jgi:hypothetical protein
VANRYKHGANLVFDNSPVFRPVAEFGKHEDQMEACQPKFMAQAAMGGGFNRFTGEGMPATGV